MEHRKLLVVVLLLATASAACSTTLRAKVLDAQTGQPVVGAVVVGVWTRTVGFVHHDHELVGVRETITDTRGRFVLERLRGSVLFGADNESVTVYRPGFLAWNNVLAFPSLSRRPQQRVPDTIVLQRFPPGQSHKEHVQFVDDAVLSWLYKVDKVPQLRKALREEATRP